MSAPILIVGLGNPGPRYAATRHNIGHMVLDALAEEIGASFKASGKAQADVIEGRLGGYGADSVRVVFAKPTTYMNVSGTPVQKLKAFYGAEELVVVHDDIDLPFDTVRLKRGGGEGGHNGLKDISRCLGTKDYLRVRAGVGRPAGRMEVSDHVLAPFTAEERQTLPLLIDDTAQATLKLVLNGLTQAQQEVHAKAARK
ncbi:aminoacyl-tRNA hydrolase [Dermabacteraceae bacterium TAE3-ERU27]|nr:aminoacyl-tRNA hydrolase [Dermabacteraceae bacterium TAE3-ERU27]